MRKHSALFLAGLTLVGAQTADAARENLGVIDVAPAATLLIPFFEVDLDSAANADTTIVLRDATASAALAHVVVWSDLGVPVLNFNIYLTGYDQVTFRMSEVLGGLLPQSATDGQDPNDTISNQGMQSQDINYASCNGVLPPAALSAVVVADVEAALTGQPVPGSSGQCAGLNHGDRRARGYVTIDTVSNCTTNVPGDPGYFVNGGVGDATNQNYLTGSYVLLDGVRQLAQTLPAAHIQASDTIPELTQPGRYTFYGRLLGWNAADNREPLATRWGVEYDADADQATEIIAWRDTKVPPATFVCTSKPAFYPLGQEMVAMLDQQENITFLGMPVPGLPGEVSAPFAPFAAATNRVRVGSEALPTTSRAGWVALSLNTQVAGVTGPTSDTAFAQSYVTAIHYPEAVTTAAPLGTVGEMARPLDGGFIFVSAGQPTSTDSLTRSAFGALDAKPGATLLLPYFEVDLADMNGVNTSFTIQNTTPTAMLAHVVVWTDYGVPSYTTNLYLTGLDVSMVDLRLLFSDGIVERTASDGQDPTEEFSPQGQYSQDINFASCTGILPPLALTDERIAHLRAVHTGKPGPLWDDNCGGAALGDNVARGFVTVDTYNSCSFATPHDAGFSPAVTFQNTLAGSYRITNRLLGTTYGGPLTTVEAGPAASELGAGKYTFYGRTSDYSGVDAREPLGAQWQVPFFNGVVKSELLVWRDPRGKPEPFACNAAPAAVGQQSILAFDEQENVTEIMTANVFPRSAMRVPVSGAGLAVPYTSGFFALDLGSPSGGGGPSGFTGLRQSVVNVVHHAVGASSAEQGAVTKTIREAQGL